MVHFKVTDVIRSVKYCNFSSYIMKLQYLKCILTRFFFFKNQSWINPVFIWDLPIRHLVKSFSTFCLQKNTNSVTPSSSEFNLKRHWKHINFRWLFLVFWIEFCRWGDYLSTFLLLTFLIASILKSLAQFLTARHYTNSQNSMISFGYVVS